jgi:hypothetical protein
MPNTLFSRHLVSVDADNFKRVELRNLRSRDGNRVDWQGTVQTGSTVNPNFPQQTRELNMKISQLVEEFKNLSISERCAFIDQVSAAIGTTKSAPTTPVPTSTLDKLLASASEERRPMVRAVYAEASRYGVQIPTDRLLSPFEVTRAMKASGHYSPELSMTLKDRMHSCGLLED